MSSNPLAQKYASGVSSGSSGNGRRFDILATVKGYDVDKGVMHVERAPNAAMDESGFPVEFSVAISRHAPAPTRSDADFEGNVIDGRMAEYLAPDSQVILEAATLYPGQQQEKPYPVNWISSIPGMNPKKVVSGVITVDGYRREGGEAFLSGVQVWSERAIDAQALLNDPNGAINKAFDSSAQRSMDVREARENNTARPPVKPSLGFALRAIKDGEVVDFTPAISFNTEEKRAVNAEDVRGAIEWYLGQTQEAYPDASVEVLLHKDYRVSPNESGSMVRGPVSTMMSTTGKYNIDNDLSAYKVLACPHGILALSAGKQLPNGTRKNAENDWVNRIYASSRKTHVHEAIASASGAMVKVNELLEMTYPQNPQQQQSTEQAQRAQQSEGQASDPEPEPAGEQSSSAGDELDDALSQAVSQAARSSASADPEL